MKPSQGCLQSPVKDLIRSSFIRSYGGYLSNMFTERVTYRLGVQANQDLQDHLRDLQNHLQDHF